MHNQLKYLLTATCIIFLISPVAHAQENITDQKIRDFYKQSSSLDLMTNEERLVDFLERHTHNDAQMTLHIITNIQGVPPQKQTQTFSKKEIIRETVNGFKMSTIESVENTILNVKIGADQKTASVKDSTYSISKMSVPTPQGTMSFKSEQSMLCDSDLVLGVDAVIQSKTVECNVETNLTPLQ